MKISPVTIYQCEDGQSFVTLQEAEHHMDVLDLARELTDECRINDRLAMEAAEHLYDKYDITLIPQPTLPAQD